jgi:glycosyltransferase involved in cell wall biosynthesis
MTAVLSSPHSTFAVAIPTKDRPEKLGVCLESLSAAQKVLPTAVYVCDSSQDRDTREAVREICAQYPFVQLSSHDGRNLTAARNACARAVKEDLVINVDDDLRVKPDAIKWMVERYQSTSGPRVVGGYTAVDGEYLGPVKVSALGWGRAPREGETPHYLIGAFFLYPRAVGLLLPWNERLGFDDDQWIGAVWRSKGIQLLVEPRARAVHDESHLQPPRESVAFARTGAHGEWERAYTLMFDAMIANPSLKRAISYEVLGFLSGAKVFARRPSLGAFVRAWIRGHRALVADRSYLRELLARELPSST